MPKLPLLSGTDVVKALHRLGYEIDHQTGSHMILRQNKEPFRRLTVSHHREIAKGTLLSIIKQVGLTREEFFEFL
ncbi:TPA: addiction module toxin, HicA family [Candidatus Woesearchaeota archaeon]|nr:MAG: YcfA family protein [archaeon GW2011_AR16]HIG96097.1 addiction module toxin, HicA family [Candidatus Woesearchaeota archaeon]HIH46976.1 addiction module toxin, HicA family [Candidatus Woesearchaeota archaeon]